MKMIKLLVIASFTLFLMTGIAGADELDDLDVTIRMMESDDDVNEVEHELSLPDSASDSAREHAEDDGHENEGETHSSDDVNDDQDGHEEDQEDQEDNEDDRDEHEEGAEDHEDDTEDHEDGTSDDDSTSGT